jgi:hypothetical protein
MICPPDGRTTLKVARHFIWNTVGDLAPVDARMPTNHLPVWAERFSPMPLRKAGRVGFAAY